MGQVIDKEWISKFDTYKQWYNSLTRRSRTGKVSDVMRSNYDSVLRQFMSYVNSKDGLDETITPDSFIEWAGKVEPEEVIDVLNSFELWLQGKKIEGYSKRVLVRNERFSQPYTANQKAQGAARGFITHNKIWLPKGRKTSGFVGKTKKNDVNYAVFKYDSESQRVVQDYTQLRYFLSNLSFRDQTVALCLLSTSQDISNLLELKIRFVTAQQGRDRLFWGSSRTKTGEIFKTFFSREATRYLRQYIAQERQGAKDNDPIFVRTGDKEEPLLPRHVSSTSKVVAQKMGIDNGEAQNPFRPKRLRSIFSTACYQAKIDDGARHLFMGHSGTVSESYREIPEANLEAIYARVEPFLTVYAEDSTTDLIETKRKSAQAYDMALAVTEENKRIKAVWEELAERLGRAEAFIEYLGYDIDSVTGEVKYDEEKDKRRN